MSISTCRPLRRTLSTSLRKVPYSSPAYTAHSTNSPSPRGPFAARPERRAEPDEFFGEVHPVRHEGALDGEPLLIHLRSGGELRHGLFEPLVLGHEARWCSLLDDSRPRLERFQPLGQ